MATVSDNLTLSNIAELTAFEEKIETLQTAKRDFYKAVRDEHGKTYANGLKSAIKLSRMDSEKRTAQDEIDAETFRILALIKSGATRRAPPAREIIEEFGAQDETDEEFSAGVQIMRERAAAELPPAGDLEQIIETLQVGGDTDHADSGLVEAEPREVAAQSTAAGMDPRQNIRLDTPAGGEPGEGRVAKSDGAVSIAGAGRTAAGTQAPPVDTSHEAPGKPASPQGLAAPGTVAAAIKLLRPLCQHPDVCAGHGTSLCFGCRREAQLSGEAA